MRNRVAPVLVLSMCAVSCGRAPTPADVPAPRRETPVSADITPAKKPTSDTFESDNKGGGVRPADTDTVQDARDVQALRALDGRRVRVRGRVYNARLARSGKVLHLNFGPDWRTCFTAPIFQRQFERWDGGAAGIQASYQGKVVIVEGDVTMYNGLPQVIVNSPDQLKLAD